jgi:hypothetical protein
MSDFIAIPMKSGLIREPESRRRALTFWTGFQAEFTPFTDTGLEWHYSGRAPVFIATAG